MTGSKGPSVLVVAADPGLRRGVATALEGAWRVHAAQPSELRDPAGFVDVCGAVAVLDGREGERGLAALAPIRGLAASARLVLAGHVADEKLLEAALDLLRPAAALPWPAPAALLRHAVSSSLPAGPCGEGARPGQRRAPALLGVSAAIRSVLDEVRRVAPSNLPVLILGETGTGKELVARSVHEHSPRSRGPFVPMNCGALPEALLEGELFGFQRGAFTGAQRDKPGLFEQADGGTLFLDEIGDMPPSLQVKLLRVLESGEVRRLGDTRTRHVDVRIVSATHRPLEEMVVEGSFRQDLLYRLNAVAIAVPPLRRRRVDIPFLAQHFAEEFGAAQARRIALADDFLDALAVHDFPGNVRELRNAVERAIALAAPGEPVCAEHLPEALRGQPVTEPGPGAPRTLRERLEQVERSTIRAALRESGGNLTRAAAALGVSRVGLRQKMKRLGIAPAPRSR